MRKLLNWCKENGLYALTLFLLAFIPLYPKLPLFDIVQTWVYIRLDDVLLLVAAVILCIDFIRQRRFSQTPLRIPILVYWAVGLISLINAVLFIFPHFKGFFFPHLAILHFLRRIEYMMVFFVAFEAFRRRRNLMPFLYALGGTLLVVTLYGMAQKFLGFPAFLTMNEEFSKGIPVRLPPTARFPSTFGGHYDLAAYLVLVIPIMGSLAIGMRLWWQKILYLLFAYLGLLMLLFTASRVSFGVYLVAMSVMFIWQKKSLLIIPLILVSFLTMNFVTSASERFYKTFRFSDIIIDLSTGRPVGTLDKLEGGKALLEKPVSPAEETLPTGSAFISAPTTLAVEQIKRVQYYKSIDVEGGTGDIATISGSFLISKALVYDISITTRIQAEWPKAVEAFKRNFLLGSGYSTLSVAVDGDYHRMFGETGIAGAVAFLGIFAAAFYLFKKRKDTLVPVERAFVVGLFAGIVGLLLNAVLIDVFEASKVAYTLWILLGVAIAALMRGANLSLNYFSLLKRIATSPAAYVFYLLLALLLVWGKTFHMYFLGDDFTWLRWAAESRFYDISAFFTESKGFFYRPIPKLWYFILYAVFWLKPFLYHGMSVFLLLFTVFFVYRILDLQKIPRVFCWFGALLIGVLASHHENVYWISGQSSMLAAFFLTGAVYLLNEESYGFFKRVPKVLIMFFVSVATFCSMLSYDGMVTAPVIVWMLAVWRNKKNIWPWALVLLLPLYLWMRSNAAALAPQGDYGYKTSTLFINTVSNTAGYAVTALLGPRILVLWNFWRAAMRVHIREVSMVTVFILLTVLTVVWRIKAWVRKYQECAPWFIAFLLSLAVYAPLGGMADRYVYIPSIFFTIGVILFLARFWKETRSSAVRWGIVAGCSVLLIWNISETNRLGGDWEKASSIAEQTLQVVKKETFPPKDVKTFFFVNTPIRYGSAWVFPTGLPDAIWHMYRQSPYSVYFMSTLKEAYDFPLTLGDREVFVFEDYHRMKRGIMEEVIIPKETENK